ncbi:unnamed protein product, partial [Ectocarpus sp. 12 AP-2014]
QDILRVKNGFNSDWMPSGYRDVKLNPVVKEHLCEIQLHLREFFVLKGGQHAVYDWARELNVTTEIDGEHLIKNLSPEVTKEMMRLAGENWRGTGYLLQDLQLDAGQYDLAETSFREKLRDAEHKVREFEDDDSKDSRRALLSANAVRARLAHILSEKVRQKQFSSTTTQTWTMFEILFVAESVSHVCMRSSPYFERKLELVARKHALGQEHADVAQSLNNMAGSRVSGTYPEARPLYQGPIEVGETIRHQMNFALSSPITFQGKYEEAEPLFERSQAIREKALGPEHADVARSLVNRAGLLRAQGKYEEAEPLYVRSLSICDKALGPDHPAVATALDNRASLLDSQAEPPYERSHPIREKVLGPEHPDMVQSLNDWARLLSVSISSPVTFQGKYEEAEPLYVRSLAIRERVCGPDHPDVATSINSWAGLLRAQGKYAEAVLLYERSQAIREKAVGPEHPDVAQSLNNRAGMLRAQGNYEEAEALYKRTQEILEKSLGREHPNIAIILNNRATMLWNQGNFGEAELLRESYRSWRENTGARAPESCRVAEQPGGVIVQAGQVRRGGTAVQEDAGHLGEFVRAGASKHCHNFKQPGDIVTESGQARRSRTIVRESCRYWRESIWSRAPKSCRVAEQPGGVVDQAGEVHGGKSTLGKGPLNPYEEPWGNHPDTVGLRNDLELVRKKV